MARFCRQAPPRPGAGRHRPGRALPAACPPSAGRLDLVSTRAGRHGRGVGAERGEPGRPARPGRAAGGARRQAGHRLPGATATAPCRPTRACSRLFGAEDGTPPAVMDGACITAARTGAAAVVAANALAYPDARVLAILGADVQGRSHLEACRACGLRRGPGRYPWAVRGGSGWSGRGVLLHRRAAAGHPRRLAGPRRPRQLGAASGPSSTPRRRAPAGSWSSGAARS